METSGISFVDLRNGEEDDEDGMFVIPVDIDKPISLCQDLRSLLSTSNVHEKLNSDLALILGEYQLLLVNEQRHNKIARLSQPKIMSMFMKRTEDTGPAPLSSSPSYDLPSSWEV